MDKLPHNVIELILSYLPGNLRYKVLYGRDGADEYGFNNVEPIKFSIVPFVDPSDIFNLIKIDQNWANLHKYNCRCDKWIETIYLAKDFPKYEVELSPMTIELFMDFFPESVNDFMINFNFDYDPMHYQEINYFMEPWETKKLQDFWEYLSFNKVTISNYDPATIKRLQVAYSIERLKIDNNFGKYDLQMIKYWGIKELDINVKGKFNFPKLSELKLKSLRLTMAPSTGNLGNIPSYLTHLDLIHEQDRDCEYDLSQFLNLNSCIISIESSEVSENRIKFPENLEKLEMFMKDHHIVPSHDFFPPNLKYLDLIASGRIHRRVDNSIKIMYLGGSSSSVTGSFPTSIHHLGLQGHFPKLPKISNLDRLLQLTLVDTFIDKNSCLELPANLEILRFDADGDRLANIKFNNKLIDVNINGNRGSCAGVKFPDSIQFLKLDECHEIILRNLPPKLVGIDIGILFGNEAEMDVKLPKSVKVLRYNTSIPSRINDIIPSNSNWDHLEYMFLEGVMLTPKMLNNFPKKLKRLSLKGCFGDFSQPQLDLSKLKIDQLELDVIRMSKMIKVPPSLTLLSVLFCDNLDLIDTRLIRDFHNWISLPYLYDCYEYFKL